ncbi:hypothetical protein HDU67_004046 [Dinochytrium kinnereticum]|nr:hypothetical protein HDU67_004046 [Dinochytrium kinnereticum]
MQTSTLENDVVAMESFEHAKENIQPLAKGRSAKTLATVYGDGSSTSSGKREGAARSAKVQDAEDERIRLEKAVSRVKMDSDDPLDPYHRLLQWYQGHHPSGHPEYFKILEKAARGFRKDPRYKNDLRYVRIWLDVAAKNNAPDEVFKYLALNEIGQMAAVFYEEQAAFMETSKRFQDADDVYRLGINRKVLPLERLQRKHEAFLKRWEKEKQKQCEEEPEPINPSAVVRPVLGRENAPPSAVQRPDAPATQSRMAQSQQPKKKIAVNSTSNAKMKIFQDSEPTSSVIPVSVSSSIVSSSRSDLEIGTSRRKENEVLAEPWRATKISQQSLPKPTSGKIEVFCDEEDVPVTKNADKYVAPNILASKPVEEVDRSSLQSVLKDDPATEAIPTSEKSSPKPAPQQKPVITGASAASSLQVHFKWDVHGVKKGGEDVSFEEIRSKLGRYAFNPKNSVVEKEPQKKDPAIPEKRQRTNDENEKWVPLKDSGSNSRNLSASRPSDLSDDDDEDDDNVFQALATADRFGRTIVPVKATGFVAKKTGLPSPTINTKAALADVFEMFNAPIQDEQFEEDVPNPGWVEVENDETVSSKVFKVQTSGKLGVFMDGDDDLAEHEILKPKPASKMTIFAGDDDARPLHSAKTHQMGIFIDEDPAPTNHSVLQPKPQKMSIFAGGDEAGPHSSGAAEIQATKKMGIFVDENNGSVATAPQLSKKMRIFTDNDDSENVKPNVKLTSKPGLGLGSFTDTGLSPLKLAPKPVKENDENHFSVSHPRNINDRKDHSFDKGKSILGSRRKSKSESPSADSSFERANQSFERKTWERESTPVLDLESPFLESGRAVDAKPDKKSEDCHEKTQLSFGKARVETSEDLSVPALSTLCHADSRADDNAARRIKVFEDFEVPVTSNSVSEVGDFPDDEFQIDPPSSARPSFGRGFRSQMYRDVMTPITEVSFEGDRTIAGLSTIGDATKFRYNGAFSTASSTRGRESLDLSNYTFGFNTSLSDHTISSISAANSGSDLSLGALNDIDLSGASRRSSRGLTEESSRQFAVHDNVADVGYVLKDLEPGVKPVSDYSPRQVRDDDVERFDDDEEQSEEVYDGEDDDSPLEFASPCDPFSDETKQVILLKSEPRISDIPGHFDCTRIPGSLNISNSVKRSLSEADIDSVCKISLGLKTVAFRIINILGKSRHVFAIEELDGSVDDGSQETTVLKGCELARWEYYVISLIRSEVDERSLSSIVEPISCLSLVGMDCLRLRHNNFGTMEGALKLSKSGGFGNGVAANLEGVDELLAAFWSIELLRAVDDLHAAGFTHGALQPDNIMLRFPSENRVSTRYCSSGSGGWNDLGILLVDFVRAVRLDAFPSNQLFSLPIDLKELFSEQNSAEDMNAWVLMLIDWLSAAKVIHLMICGRFLECKLGDTSTIKPQLAQHLDSSNLEMWQNLLSAILAFPDISNLLQQSYNADDIPSCQPMLQYVKNIRSARQALEAWLEGSSFKSGKSLKNLLQRVEIAFLTE